jgi:chromate transporter
MHNQPLSQAKLFFSFLKLGLTAFGGPAMIAHIRTLAVNRNEWMDDRTFKDGVALAQALPGATAMQVAAYVGLRSRGVLGAMLSYIGFGLPAFLLMVLLSALYERTRNVAQIASLFNGLQVIVVALVVSALYSFGRSTVKSARDVVIACVSAALFWQGLNPMVVIMAAGLLGIALRRDHDHAAAQPSQNGNGKKMLASVAAFIALVFAGLAVLYAVDRRLFELAFMMLRIDLFAFGGGFGSLPLMLHEVVQAKAWMDFRTFMDGVALGQVTPGPIVITAVFVGYLGQGFIGAFVAALAVFTPSFILLVAATPVYDRIKSSPSFAAAINGILASFIGLLFFVGVKFLLAVPWDPVRILLGLGALIALLMKTDVLLVVLIGAGLSIIAL